MFKFLRNRNYTVLQWTVLLVFIFAVYFGIAMLFGYLVNTAFQQFNANWTSFWGWTIMFAIAPAVRGWITGNGD